MSKLDYDIWQIMERLLAEIEAKSRSLRLLLQELSWLRRYSEAC